MKKTVLTIVLSAFMLGHAFSNEEVLLKIHDREITKDEFLRIYNKNNNSNTIDNKTVDEYLELFINFKLKVIEAEELGYDTLTSFINEFEQYRKQLVKPYFIDKDAEESLIKEAYERMQQEVNASHILIRVSEKASPADTAKAYEKAMELRQRIINGEGFADVARATSDDPSAKTNDGELGYFTVFSMVYPFENAAYETPVGELSMPVRSSFGYHIVKVNDKRPARGEIKVAHIMKMTPNTMSPEEKDSAKEEIFKIYESIKAGEDFAQLAITLSDDKQSGNQGGELPWFKSTDRIVREFVDACFEIENNGGVTQPFLSPFGWHIVKRIDHKGLKSYEELKDDLRERVKNDPKRSIISEETAVEKLKRAYAFSENPSALDYFKNGDVVTEAIFNSDWKASECKSDETLFTLNGNGYSQKDFAQYLEDNQKEISPYDISVYVKGQYDGFVKKSVLDYEESRLDEKYPDYKYLVQEYHDGILLFNLNDEMVWSKAVKDSAGLANFYEQHKEDYMWGQRVRATVYQSADEKKLKSIRKLEKKGAARNNEAVEQVCDTLNPKCVTYQSGLFLQGDNKVVDTIAWKMGVSKPLKIDGKNHLVAIHEIVPPQAKEFEEAAGLITSDYQNFLDKQWIEELRSKYEIIINQDILSSLK
jgi:peptidyl-prolyl cis-trans isomerase SurA